MQKEVSDSGTMCSLDSAWQSALRQRLRRKDQAGSSEQKQEKAHQSHILISREPPNAPTRAVTGGIHHPIIPCCLFSHLSHKHRPGCRPDVEGKRVTVSAGEAVLHMSVPLMPLSSVLLQTQLAPACSHTRQQYQIWSKTRGDTPKT